MERRRKAPTHLNAELSTLVEDEDSFKDAAPLLFGRGFDQKAKDHVEAIKSLKKTDRLVSLFRGATPTVPGRWHVQGQGTKNFRPKRT